MQFNRALIFNFLVASILMLNSCNKMKKTESGIEYQHVIENNTEKAKVDDYISFNFSIKTSTDSVISESKSPFTAQVGKNPAIKILDEIIMDSAEGDSVNINISASKLFSNRVPPGIDSAEVLKMNLKLLKVQSPETYAEEQKKMEEERVLAQEEEIKSYIEKEQFDAQKTESGLYYVITEEGKGKKAAAGDMVVVHYKGTLLDGTKFDASYDRNQPFEFTLGKGQVIRGWDEGIALLSKGAKATLIVPSELGYGARGAGGIIKPHSVLRFDVELVDIK